MIPRCFLGAEMALWFLLTTSWNWIQTWIYWSAKFLSFWDSYLFRRNYFCVVGYIFVLWNLFLCWRICFRVVKFILMLWNVFLCCGLCFSCGIHFCCGICFCVFGLFFCEVAFVFVLCNLCLSGRVCFYVVGISFFLGTFTPLWDLFYCCEVCFYAVGFCWARFCVVGFVFVLWNWFLCYGISF